MFVFVTSENCSKHNSKERVMGSTSASFISQPRSFHRLYLQHLFRSDDRKTRGQAVFDVSSAVLTFMLKYSGLQVVGVIASFCSCWALLVTDLKYI